MGFELTISASEWPQIYALDRAASIMFLAGSKQERCPKIRRGTNDILKNAMGLTNSELLTTETDCKVTTKTKF